VPEHPATGHTAESRLIRLAILDDNPFERGDDARVRPRAARFHEFAAEVVARGPFEPAAYLIPVRNASNDRSDSGLPAVDETRLRITPTLPFDGIRGYASRAPRLLARNWPIVRRAVAGADLVWIKAPASNAVLAALAARRAHVPRFTWVAGSVREVVAGQPGSRVWRLSAGLLALGYDAVTGILERTGPAIRLDAELFTSTIRLTDIAATRARRRPRPEPAGGALRVVWAGRIRPDKGLDDLLRALGSLVASGRLITLDVVGDGPEVARMQALAGAVGLADGTVRWHGYVGAREPYLELLRAADVFVLPSRAEGLPKVIVEAMAAGTAVVATSVGAVASIVGTDRGRLVRPGRPDLIAAAVAELQDDPDQRARFATAGLAFAADHTTEAQADRLVAWLRATYPALPWPTGADPT
jgi:glycosyltransferase involved in cell wall biosynthesis